MCTLIVLHRCVADRPLVVAANRDEFLDRPAESVAIRSSKTFPIVAPLDLEAGGTWVGLNQRGVFAGLTNLRPPEVSGSGADAAVVPAQRSRGDVVMAALEAENTEQAIRAVLEMTAPIGAEAGEGKANIGGGVSQVGSQQGSGPLFNPFQLLVADGAEARLIVYRDQAYTLELEPGAHIVGNVESERIVQALSNNEDWLRSQQALNGSNKQAGKRGGQARPIPGFEDVKGVPGLLESDQANPGKDNSNQDTEEPRAVKLTRIRERVEKLMTETQSDLFEGLARVCREHVDQVGGVMSSGPIPEVAHVENEVGSGANLTAPSPFESTCVHVADRYGTRSSLLLEVALDASASRLWTTDGPPCEQSFENRSSLLSELGLVLGSREGDRTDARKNR